MTYISHLIHLLEAGLQEGLEGNTVRGNGQTNFTHCDVRTLIVMEHILIN